jgi:phosphate transport system permease protein
MSIDNSQSSWRSWMDSGEPWVWMNAAAVGISIVAVVGIVLLIAVRGLAHFWPADVVTVEVQTPTGMQRWFGEEIEREEVSLDQFRGASDPAAAGSNVELESRLQGLTVVNRVLLKTGNRKSNPPDFRWFFEHNITGQSITEDVFVVERSEWGNAYGQLTSITVDGKQSNTSNATAEVLAALLETQHERSAELRGQLIELEDGALSDISYALEKLRLQKRKLEIDYPDQPAELENRLLPLATEEDALRQTYKGYEVQLRDLRQQLKRDSLELTAANGDAIHIEFIDIIQTWQPNTMSVAGKFGFYFRAIGSFLTEDPRDANTEGGIFPAIFGTVMMVLLMSALVTPFGVVAAVYLREYARQGTLVRIIRIAVNNLAGVPSIVYGVFGLGFFVYFLGGNIDELFFPQALPAPTFGTPGLLWASLTLALLTVPVVIVSTEEGLTRIPRSIREGSLALGATKAETLFRVVLPMASPSILTGVILAVARAAGEVAPLMLVGVVKLAPTLPMDDNFPFLHLDRKFMHLGFHIYDVGFQSPNVEAARPLVFATALLLVLIIIVLNLTAIMLRSRLEKRFKGVET